MVVRESAEEPPFAATRKLPPVVEGEEIIHFDAAVNLADDEFRPGPLVHDPPHELVPLAEFGLPRPHRRELDAGCLDLPLVLRVGGEDRPMAAGRQPQGDGQDRVQVAETAISANYGPGRAINMNLSYSW